MLIAWIKKFLHESIRKFDKMFGVPSDYLHFIIDTSIPAFINFAFFTRMANHRQSLPKDAYHIARILSAQNVDCGTCVQITVNMALKDKLRPEWIQAALDKNPSALSPELRDVYEFTQNILSHSYEEQELRETLRTRYGDEGLIDLAYAIATAQVFPYTKKVLGFAKSCSKVQVKVGIVES